jgi:nicotinate-nucleotide adenylyltransferase
MTQYSRLMTKTGLFFGSFNPIHTGHLIIANTMLENTDLDQVWFVVSPQNPLKKSKSLLHEFDRYEIVQRAINDNYNFKVCDAEFHLPRPSYTIDTLTYLQEKYKEHEFVLIIGEDNLIQFPQWKNYEKILEYFSLYVYPRPCSEPDELKNHPKVKMVSAPVLDISATYIRECVKNKKSIKYLVPEAVESYISEKGFYL